MAAPTTAELADPPMEPVQVAGVGSALRGIVNKATRRAGREVVPQPRGAAPEALTCYRRCRAEYVALGELLRVSHD